MTAGELLERGRAAARGRWTPTLAVAALALVLVCKLDQGRQAAHEVARLADEARLKAENVSVAALADARAVRAAFKAAVAQNEELAAELTRVNAASPGAKPTTVIRGSTGPTTAGGAPRAAGIEACRGPEEPGPAGVPPACLLAAGDKGEVRVDQALLRTKAGNIVFVGAASAWRLEPGPVTRLFGGPLAAELTVERPESPAGWGWGGAGALGPDGWAVGAAVAPPPRRLWGWQGEVVVSGAMGPTGEWGLNVTAVARKAGRR